MTERNHEGLHEALRYPLFSALFQRRSRRVSKGLGTLHAGGLTFTGVQKAQPLDALEEALLIAATGTTGITIPDMPFETPEGERLLGTPMLEVVGRAASSPDNAQATYFFLINDSGTYFLKRPDVVDPKYVHGLLTPDALVAYVDQCKVRVLDQRLDLPREFPCYVGRNRFVSNVPGSTILVPVVDLTKQYINGLFYLLSQTDGYRPTFIDDWNCFRTAGCGRWVKRGFLNRAYPIPLGMMNTFRIHVEADLLIQNLLLVIQAMGLGGWVHAAFAGPYLLGDPESRERYGPGLGFRYEIPQFSLMRLIRRPFTPLPAWRPNPVGLDGVLQGYCPPYYPDMATAVDAVVAGKYGKDGIYAHGSPIESVFRSGFGNTYLEEVPHLDPRVIECCKDICTYIFRTYGRFPAHVDAMYVPGIWVQAHHLDLEYYDQFYMNGYSSTQARHQTLWHSWPIHKCP